MSSEAEDAGPTPGRQTLSVDPGEQVLVERPDRGAALSVLPDEAFDNLLVVSAGQTPADVERTVRERFGALRPVGVVPITATFGEYDGPLWTTDPVSPSDLTGISVRVSQAFPHLRPETGRLTVGSISTLLMYAAEDRVYRLFDWLASNARAESVRGVYTLQPDAVTEQTRRRFRSLFDTVERI